jgi:cytosine/adenosine deaminase-related metal-dependent hydrolase
LYTLHLEAARTLLDAALANNVRPSVHLAEHPSERRAIEEGDGPIADWFATRFKSNPSFPKKPLFDVAAEAGALRAGVVLVHLTEARPEELARVAESGASVVFCPRSNLYIEGKLPPLLAARAAGIDVALGTDSLASNVSLDVLAEAKALADRFSSVPADDLIAMATWNGARALGRPDLGRFAKGARPGMFAVDGAGIEHPSRWLLTHLAEPRRCIIPRASRTTGPSSGIPATARSL